MKSYAMFQISRGGGLCLTLVALALVLGCGEGGPTRYRISGEVKLDGRPIPFGDVLFTPDDAKGHSGPQGIANIRDGKFDTSATGGQHIAGGPTVIKVTGLADENGRKVLCEYEYTADLPTRNSTLTIDVPAAGSSAKPESPEI